MPHPLARSRIASWVLTAVAVGMLGCGDSVLRGATNEGDGHASFLKSTPTVGQPATQSSRPEPEGSPHRRGSVIGHSVEGRPIRAYVVGDPSAPRHILVVGCVHGNETAGEAIIRGL